MINDVFAEEIDNQEEEGGKNSNTEEGSIATINIKSIPPKNDRTNCDFTPEC